jgi:ornithine cyclodeaminase
MRTMHPLHIVYLNGPDIDRLGLDDTEILDAVESGLDAQGRQRAVMGPDTQLVPETDRSGHFDVSGGVIESLGLAGVMVAGAFGNNHEIGLPSEAGMLTLFDPATGVPLAIMNANSLMHIRTGAMTAVGAKYLARKASKVLGHLGAGASAYWNIRLLNHLFDFDEIRVHSPAAQAREMLDALSQELGKRVTSAHRREECVRGADIVVDASQRPTAARVEIELLDTEWIRPGTLVITCATMGGDHMNGAAMRGGTMDKVVVDDGNRYIGNAKNGHAQLGEIVAQRRPGRERDAEIILYRQCGLALADVALASVVLDKAGAMSIGQTLRWE